MSKVLRKARSKASKPKAPVPTTPDDLAEVLGVFVSQTPSKEDLDYAESVLREFMKTSAALFPMLEQIQSNENPSIRQVAAVLLHKRIEAYWRDAKMKGALETAKSMLIEMLTQEQFNPARNAIAHLAIVVAETEKSSRPWQALLELMLQLAQSSNERDVELGLLLMRYLGHIRAIAEHRSDMITLLFNLCRTSQSPVVRSRSLAALYRMFVAMYKNASMSQEEGEDENAWNPLLPFANEIPTFMEVLNTLIEDGNEDAVVHMLNILRLFEEAEALGDNVHLVITHICTYAEHTEIPLSVRSNATSLLVFLLQNRPIIIEQGDHYDRIFNLSLSLLREPDDEMNETESGETAQVIGMEVLEQELRLLPRGQVFKSFLAACDQLYASEVVWDRRASLLVWSVMIEVMPDDLTTEDKGEYFRNVLRVTSARHAEEDVVMQIAYLRMVSQYNSHFGAEVVNDAETFLTALVQTFDLPLEKQTLQLLERTLCCVEMCAQALGPLMGEFAERFVDISVRYLEHAEPRIRTTAMSALAALIEHKVAPAAELYSLLKPALLAAITEYNFKAMKEADETNEEALELRNSATQALGALIYAVGPEVAQEVIEPCLENMFSALVDCDDFEAREHSYYFLGQVAKTWGKDLPIELLDRIVLVCIQAISSEEGIRHKTDDEDEEGNTGLGNFLAGTDDEDEDDDESGEDKIIQKLRSYIERKEDDDDDDADEEEDAYVDLADDDEEELEVGDELNEYRPVYSQGALRMRWEAQSALVKMMNALGEQMPIRYVRLFVSSILNQVQLPSHAQMWTIDIEMDILRYLAKYYPNPEGTHQGIETEMHSNASELVRGILLQTVAQINDECDPDVACSCFQLLTLANDLFGMVATPGDHLIIQKKSKKKRHQPAEEDEEEGVRYIVFKDFWEEVMKGVVEDKAPFLIDSENALEGGSHGENVMTAYFDYIGALARNNGQKFVSEYFDAIFEPFVNYALNEKKNDTFRAGAIGALAEIFDFAGQHCLHYVPHLIPLLPNWLLHPTTDIARNAAYLVGCIFRVKTTSADPAEFAPTLQALAELYNRHHGERDTNLSNITGCLDNIAAAFVKGLVYCHQIFEDPRPVLQLVLGECIPLVSDFTEANEVYTLLKDLYALYPDVLTPFIPSLVKSLSISAQEPLINLETEGAIAQLFHMFAEQAPELFQQGVDSVAQDEAAARALSNLFEYGQTDPQTVAGH